MRLENKLTLTLLIVYFVSAVLTLLIDYHIFSPGRFELTSFYLLLVLLVITSSSLWIVSKRVIRPIVILRKAFGELSKGNFDLDINMKGSSSEIVSMIESFKKMAQQLKTTQDTLRRYGESLEGMVRDRTDELERTVTELNESRRVLLSILEDTDDAKRRLESALSEVGEKQGQLIQSAKLTSLGQMAAGVAHEINNPLMNILGYSQLALARKDIDESFKEDLKHIEHESKRCVSIIDNLLNFARPVPSKKMMTDIHFVLEGTLKVIEYSIRRENVEIKKSLIKDLPQIMADSYKLQQVFMNLVLNAVNAMPGGGTLEIATFVRDKNVVISFADTGRGIPKMYMGKLFEPFFTTAFQTGKKGTGLGLSISYSIVKEHGGEIEVESEEGKGSKFSVILPIDRPQTADRGPQTKT